MTIDDRTLIRRTIIGVIIVFGAAAVLAFYAEEPLTRAADLFMERWGAGGLALGVIILDTSPFPLINEPILLLAYQGGMSAWDVLLVAGGASVLAGSLGYLYGFILNKIFPVRRWMEERRPNAVAWIHKHGAKGVAVAAVLPIPFSVATWTAGAMGVPWKTVALASLLRIPKTGFYLWLIVTGLAVGGS